MVSVFPLLCDDVKIVPPLAQKTRALGVVGYWSCDLKADPSLSLRLSFLRERT